MAIASKAECGGRSAQAPLASPAPKSRSSSSPSHTASRYLLLPPSEGKNGWEEAGPAAPGADPAGPGSIPPATFFHHLHSSKASDSPRNWAQIKRHRKATCITSSFTEALSSHYLLSQLISQPPLQIMRMH